MYQQFTQLHCSIPSCKCNAVGKKKRKCLYNKLHKIYLYMEMTFNMHLFIFWLLHMLQRCGQGRGGVKLGHVDGLYICDGQLSPLMWKCGKLFMVALPVWALTTSTQHSKKWIKVCKTQIDQGSFWFLNLMVLRELGTKQDTKQKTENVFPLHSYVSILHEIQDQYFWIQLQNVIEYLYVQYSCWSTAFT